MRKRNLLLVVLILLCVGAIVLVAVKWDEQIRHERQLREYPALYTQQISLYAAEYELDPYLVTAIIRRESSFDPDAVSSKGAVGLMQIMPDTGEWIAHKLGQEPYDPETLYDPDTNIRYGCWYLAFLTRRFEGETRNIVAAYNAGHGTVEAWLADPRYSAEGVVTEVPYEQTARYLDKVNDAYRMYRLLYPELYGDPVAVGPVL